MHHVCVCSSKKLDALGIFLDFILMRPARVTAPSNPSSDVKEVTLDGLSNRGLKDDSEAQHEEDGRAKKRLIRKEESHGDASDGGKEGQAIPSSLPSRSSVLSAVREMNTVSEMCPPVKAAHSIGVSRTPFWGDPSLQIDDPHSSQHDHHRPPWVHTDN